MNDYYTPEALAAAMAINQITNDHYLNNKFPKNQFNAQGISPSELHTLIAVAFFNQFNYTPSNKAVRIAQAMNPKKSPTLAVHLHNLKQKGLIDQSINRDHFQLTDSGITIINKFKLLYKNNIHHLLNDILTLDQVTQPHKHKLTANNSISPINNPKYKRNKNKDKNK